MEINSTNFNKQFIELVKDARIPKNLSFHQVIPVEYLLNTKGRGLLVYATMGSGKTRTMVAAAEAFRKKYKVIVLTSKSLHDNMREGVRKYYGNSKKPDEIEAHIQDNYTFVSLNSNNVAKHLSGIDDILEEQLGMVVDEGTLEGCMLLVDEAHRLFNSIVRGSKNAVKLYDMIMGSRNIKILFCTGTPIQNDSFELVACMNMLAGFPILGESYEEFHTYFSDPEYREKLKDRLSPFVSFYTPEDRSMFPEQLPTDEIKVEMSDYQMGYYLIARKKEKDQTIESLSRPKRSTKPLQLPSPVGASFRVKSRQISNCVENISSFDLETLKKFSPKTVKSLEIINSREKQNGLFYSQFKKYGSDVLAKSLEHNYGWNRVNSIKTAKNTGKGYAIISGDVPPMMRTELVNIFNSPANLHGEIIRLLIISETGAEGLDLHNIRYVIIYEPFFNKARINQIIARAVRYGSHKELEPSERNVQTYILIAVKPPTIKAEDAKEPSTDEILWMNSVLNMDKINYFLEILKEASIDCFFNHKKDCHICTPTNQPLYSKNMLKDLELPSPCIPYKEEDVIAYEVLVDGQKFSYSFDDPDRPSLFNIHVYRFDNSINSYIEINSSHPSYTTIVDSLSL
jgi:SNF2 family DNA or RNA helicase